MSVVVRLVEDRDIPGMAAIRAREWETLEYWEHRIARYLGGELSPQQALSARAAFGAEREGVMVGFVAGHLTRRHACEGELEWINVVEEYRGQGIAGLLLERMAEWFLEQEAHRVCVNVAPENVAARGLYANAGAQRLNEHWMIWEDIQGPRARFAQRDG